MEIKREIIDNKKIGRLSMEIKREEITVLESLLRFKVLDKTVLAVLSGYKNIGTAKNRLSKLKKMGFIKDLTQVKSYGFIGQSNCYFITAKGIRTVTNNINDYKNSNYDLRKALTPKVTTLEHSIFIGYLLAYLKIKYKVSTNLLFADRELFKLFSIKNNHFNNLENQNKHRPDLATTDFKTVFEIELSPKPLSILLKNIQQNDKEIIINKKIYKPQRQIWMVKNNTATKKR